MKAQGVKQHTVRIAGLLALFALSAAAVGLQHMQHMQRHAPTVDVSQARVQLPANRIRRTLLPDGRTLELDGALGEVSLVDGATRTALKLPEQRRFASVTVMPSGQVLLWGGVDKNGKMLTQGEWFAPSTGRFTRTGFIGLPARAGQAMTVLTDGRVLMVGGWGADGKPASTAVIWRPSTHTIASSVDMPGGARLQSDALIQFDGAIRIVGGVDSNNRPRSDALLFMPLKGKFDRVAYPSPAIQGTGIAVKVVATFPAANADAAPIRGKLAIRFSSAVAVRQLNSSTVTLLGPNGVNPITVVGADNGQLAFIQPPDDLYPGSHYTLFVQGLHAADGSKVPYFATGFTTETLDAAGVVVGGAGQRPVAPARTVGQASSALPAISLVTGNGVEASCPDTSQGILCRERSFIRDGAWFPGRNNAPDSSGARWRLYQPHQSLPDTRVLQAHLPSGSTGLIGQIRQIDERPVANVEVSVGAIKARTDAKGIFVLTSLPPGRQELFVDGSTASVNGVDYGRFVVGADVESKQVKRLSYVMYLPRILPRDRITLPSPTTREIVLTHPDMPGLELHIPAGTVLRDRKGHVLTHIAIVPTPVDHAPFPLPDNFLMYFTIQPGDAVVQGLNPVAAAGIRVVYPNYGHAKSNTAGNFWAYNVRQGWQIYGGGRVSADARHLMPDKGLTMVWAMGASAALTSANPPNNRPPGGCSASEPVDLETGIFFHEWNDLSIRDVMPLTLMRAYNSATTTSQMFGVGGNSNYGMHMYSANGFVTPQIVMPCGEGVPFTLVSGSANSPNSAIWESLSTNSAFYGATLQFLNLLPVAEYWVVTLRDGTEYRFQNVGGNQLVRIKDRYGNETNLSYNGGLVDQVISPSGRSITFNYEASNRVSSALDNSGRTVRYAYNTTGTLNTVTFPDATTEQYTYDTNNRMLTMRDRRNNVWVTNQYDSTGRVTKQALADGKTYQFAYGTNLTTVTDPNGHQEQLTFDPVSRFPVIDTKAYGTPLAQTITFKRQLSGLIDSITDTLGRTTTYQYDGLGNIVRLTRLAGTANAVSTQFTYTSDYNQLASVTDPLGHTATLGYTNGCLSSTTDALGHKVTIQCNSAGQPSTLTDALGHVTKLGYEGYDLQSITDPLGRTTLLATDPLGRPAVTEDPLGNVTLVQYDTNDRVTQVTDALNQSTTMHYDGNGNPLSVTLPSKAVISQTYDPRNRLLTRTDALKQVDSWTYDGMGNVRTHTDRRKQVTTTTYDALDRPLQVAYADGSSQQPTYDAGNRMTGVVDSVSGALSFGYDDLDRLTQAVTPQGTIAYAYDAAGRRTGMTPAAQAMVNYAWDAANRLSAITQGSERVQLGYDNANRRTATVLPNATRMNRSFDAGNQLTALTYVGPTGITLGQLVYGYDADGRRTAKTGSFATDLAPIATTANGSFDLNNRQTHFDAAALTYDADGNLTSDGVNTYTWNARNQLTQIKQGSVVQASYSYDALGRRTAKTLAGAAAVQYLYDGANAVQETQGSTVNPILTGLAMDERYARNDTGGRSYFFTDALNSTIALTNPAGAITQQYSYDPYGNTTASHAGFTNPYQYTGREADGAGLYYYRARYYSPGMGRFISEDPIGFGGGSLNFYGYVNQQPTGYVDQDGMGKTSGPRVPSSRSWKSPAGPGGNYGRGTPQAPMSPGSSVTETPGAWGSPGSGGVERCTGGYCSGSSCTAGSNSPSAWPMNFIGRPPSMYPTRNQIPEGCTCTHYTNSDDIPPSPEPDAGAMDAAELAARLLEMQKENQKQFEENMRD